MLKLPLILLFILLAFGCRSVSRDTQTSDWDLSVLPSSVRLDPVHNEIIEQRFILLKNTPSQRKSLLKKNWIFDGSRAELHAARGEYVSFQLVVTSNTSNTLKNIHIDMPAFKNSDNQIPVNPEFFLEWSVQVKTPSTGYPKASLGSGWYPDALIPFRYIQDDSSSVSGRWIYPLWLPDFNNRIDNQKSMMVWIDQYVPFTRTEAKPGTYSTRISVTINGETKVIPVDLTIWDFAIPNENKFKASLQHEGFLKSMDKEQELEIYQLFKRNRIALMDPTYDPGLQVLKNGEIKLDWKTLDDRLDKYFSGKAFTSEFGYEYGPGYGEPIETFVLPFDVYGKHGTPGWPDVGKPDVERRDENREIYISCIGKVRKHFASVINPQKTDITVYLNGLDESYFPEAWDRMVYYGDLFRKFYPEAHFRIDGGYSEEAMAIVKKSIDSWASHTINYDIGLIKKYQEMGIKDWIYGPMVYESKVNSWVGSSTFIDLPLVNDRAISWSCWKYNTHSWISWGIGAGWTNAWYDPETWKDASREKQEADAEFTYKKLNGNALLVYSPGIVPNVDGPCPSIRLKMLRDGVQEYEYMRLLSEVDKKKDRADSVVNSIIKMPFGPRAIGNLDIWSFDAEQWDNSRVKLGILIDKAEKNR
jgi:hypothetical protein